MEQTSEETNVSEAAAEAPATETAAAPTRRRASRRVTAAAGTVVEADEVAAGAPVAAEPETAAAKPASDEKTSDSAVEAEAAEAPKKRVSRARKKTDPADENAEPSESATDAVAVEATATKTPRARAATKAATNKAAAEVSEDTATAGETPEAPATAAKKTPATRRRKPAADAAAKAAEATETVEADSKPGETAVAKASEKATSDTSQDAEKNAAQEARAASDSQAAESGAEPAETSSSRRRNSRTRSRKPAAEASTQNAQNAQNAQNENGSSAKSEEAESTDSTSESASGDKSNERAESGANGRGGSENQPRVSRTRQRERKRRGSNDDEPEITDDDVLLPVAGILDVLDNYAFVRTSGYLPGTGDVYVSLGQVKKYGLRKGDAVVGAIRQPREGEGGGRQKYNAIVKVDTINSNPFEENQTRPEFADFTPIHPNERLRLETESPELGTRLADLFSPIGKGQRGLIIGPHEAGKSTALQQIAQAVTKNQPDAHLMLVLIDERPEEVTALQRTVNGEVISSTFDRPAEDHTTIAELAVERAKRLVELGHDVVLLIDSLTSLARAYNLGAPAAVRVPAGSLDAAAIFPVKRLLSAARNIENGGSLTIIATASAQPDSRLDEALIGELEGVANMQLRLSGEAADRRVFPAIDLGRSSTRHEALLTSDAEVKVINQLRHALADENQEEGLESVLKRLAETSSNVEFLTLAQRGRA